MERPPPRDTGMGGETLMAPVGSLSFYLSFLCFCVPKGPGQDAKKKKLSFCTSKFFYVKSDLALFWLFQRKGTQESQEHTQSILQWEMHAIEKAGQQDTNSFAARGKLSLGLAECG